jgi:Xaa-Pro aminopeptidase
VTVASATRAARADRLAELVAERGLDCLLVSNLVNVRYLTGFSGTNGACVIGPGERLFLTDFRYVERAAREVSDFEQLPAGRDLLADLAKHLHGRAGFDDVHLSVRAHARLSEQVPDGVELVPAGGLVESLREVKDADEVRAMSEAAKLGDGIYEYVCERGLVGRTEREVAIDLEREMRERGARDPAFPSIVAAADNGALPHAEPRDVEIPAGTLVVVDLGCIVDGMCSDCTRTLATGPIEDEAAEVYELVLRAQEAGLAAARPGARCREVDGAAREVIEAAGHGEHFGHGLGHGVGLEVHEGPRLTKVAEGELRPGNAVTIEPGVYLPGRFGVRIEDLVVITDDGLQNLSGFPKSLVTVES